MQQGAVQFTAMDRVIFGRPAAEAVAGEAERLGAERVFLIAGGTLNRETDAVRRIAEALAARYAGTFDRMPAHSPRDAVVAAAEAARAAGADLLVTVGGGSVTDGAKVVQICLRHDIRDPAVLDDYRISISSDGRASVPRFDGPVVRQISVPTTLSGGEFSPHAGCTDPRRKVKEGYRHPLMVPRSVILDPEITVHTPEWLWLSTGIRAVDHAVEALCSPRIHPFCEADSLHALRLLSRGLPRVNRDPQDLEARLDCQFGTWLSMTAAVAGVPMGASHGIGHVLGGTCGVPHGHTSCVMLPAVLRWNEPENAARQALVSEALGAPGRPAWQVLDQFIGGLGMPRRLAEVGVSQQDFELVAGNAMHDRAVHTNPRSVAGPQDVLEILRLAA